jgi:hypothetical protein
VARPQLDRHHRRAYHGAPDDFRVTESDIRGLLAAVNAQLPAAG